MSIQMYEVGGCVRDELLGIRSKDIDYAVVAPSYVAMRDHLLAQGFTVFLETPEHFTIRARFPNGHPNFRVTADFVLCRKEGTYTDGRRPDSVEVGTLYDDLARRDFTVNAIAKTENGTYIDPYGGIGDLLERHLLRAVGSAEARLREDALRAMRALRFRITRTLAWDDELGTAMLSEWLPPLLSSVSAERKRDELYRCLRHDSYGTLRILFRELHPSFVQACLDGGLWLKPTLEKRSTRV